MAGAGRGERAQVGAGAEQHDGQLEEQTRRHGSARLEALGRPHQRGAHRGADQDGHHDGFDHRASRHRHERTLAKPRPHRDAASHEQPGRDRRAGVPHHRYFRRGCTSACITSVGNRPLRVVALGIV